MSTVQSPSAFGLGQIAAGTGWHISGTTRFYAHLAHPSNHVRTPQVFNRAFAARGFDAAAVSFDVDPSDLRTLVDGLRGWRNLAGIGVTMPHKEAIAALVDTVSDRAKRVGAVNVIRRDRDGSLHGDNLDGIGFVTGLENAGHTVAGIEALLVGAGGAGHAIGFALAAAGVRHLGIANRNFDRAQDLASEIRTSFPRLDVEAVSASGEGYDLIVNATSLGLHSGDPHPVEIASIGSSTVVAEIVMNPAVTDWMAAAELAGIQTHSGLPMLESQVQLVIDFIGFGEPAFAFSNEGES